MTRFGRIRAAGRPAVIAALVAVVGLVATGFAVDSALAAPSPAAPTILTGPANPTTSTSAAFTFTDSSSPVTFKCALDTTSFTVCASGVSYSSLALGNHTFKVEAVSGPSTSPPTSFGWAIIPATPTITSQPANPTTSTVAAFKYSDTQSGVGFVCSFNGAAFGACASTGVSYPVTTGGSNTFAVEAQVGGNPPSAAATYTWTVTTPTPTITSAQPNPTSATSATFTYADTQAGVTFKCSLDGSNFSGCGPGGVSYTGLSNTTHTFSVQAQLGNGPASGPATSSWRVDSAAPAVTIGFPANGGAESATAWAAGCSPAGICGSASDPSGVANVAVGVYQSSSGKYWNGSSFSSNSLVLSTASGTTSWHYLLARPADGAYTVYVRATDTLGNTTTAANQVTAAFTIDTVAPAAPVITQGTTNPSTDTSPEFEFTDSSWPNVTFSCSLDSGAAANCTGDNDNDSDGATQGEWQYNNLAAGPHCFSVWATDQAGNVGAVTTSCWTITTTPAAIAVSSGSGQSAPVHTAFPAPLVAKVTDAHGQPVAGVAVTFSAPTSGPSGTFAACPGGNATSTQCVVTTNVSGIATSSTLTANTIAGGSYTVTARAAVSAPANFSLTNSPGPATTIVVASGSGQSTTVNKAFGSPLAAKVTDTYGNPITGATVTFTAPASGPSASFAGGTHTALTNSSGVATSAALTATTTAGAYSVSAVTPGTGTAVFALTNTPAAAAKLVFTAGPAAGQNIVAGTPTAVKVAVEDTYGNIETADNTTTVTLALPTNPGGSIGTCTNAGGSGPVTVAGGVASFVCSLNKTGTGYTATATSNPAHGTATSNAFNIVAGPASQLVFTAQPPTTMVAGAGFGTTVTIEDAYGNTETGDTSTVTIALANNACSAILAGSTSKAAAAGVATFPGLQITTACAGDTLKASDASDGPFVATSTPFAVTAGPATSVAVVSGSGQSSPVGAAFTSPLVAKVTDAYGNFVAGATVTFTAPSTGASATFGTCPTAPATSTQCGVTTNASGLATSPAFTANATPGGYTISAHAPGTNTVTFSETNTSVGATAIAVSTGSGQSGTVTTAFTSPLVAKVTNAQGNPVAGITVTFAAPTTGASGTFAACAGGNPTAAQCVVISNASGLASSSTFTANTAAGGPYTISATASGVATPANFSLTNTPAAAHTITVSSGSGQSTMVTTAFASPLAAKVTDTYGNPITGATVTFTAPGTGASGSFAGSVNTAVTSGSGVATSVTFTANTVAGTYTVAAGATGTGSVNFSLTNTAGTAATITVSSGSGQSATVATAFASPLAAKVTDTYGNSITGATVTFTAPGTGASGSFAGSVNTAVTSGSGVATSVTFTANTVAGTYTVAAGATGTGSVTFTLTNTAGAANQLVFTGQPPVSTPAGSPFATTVTIEDLYGNTVTGDTHTITLSLSTNPCGATLGGTVSRAANAGVATLSGLQITKACSGYTLQAADASDGPFVGTSNAFAVTPAGVSTLVFTTQPPASNPASSTFGATVTIEDLYGNVETADTTTVTLSLSANPCAGALTGSVSQAAASGAATFSGLQITTPCSGYQLTATDASDGPVAVVSQTFAITAGAATAIAVVSGNNQSASQGAAFASPLVVAVTDSHGNPVAGASVTFTGPGSGASGTFSGASNAITVTTGADGQATSGTLTANHTGGTYTVAATTPGVAAPATFSLLNGGNFTVNGSIPSTSPLSPGTGQPVDLTIINPNSEAITVPAPTTGVSVSITLGAGASADAIANCIPSDNFAMTQGLTTAVNVPPGTWSLSDLAVPVSNWPVISMIETHINQDACQSTPLSFTWSATGSGA